MSYTDQPTHPPHTGQYQPAPPVKGSNGLATAGFVLGLLGLLGSWIPVLNVVGIILGVLGVILAGIGLAKSKRANAGKGLAIAGIVCGALAVVFAILINAVFVSAVDEAIDETTKTSVDASGNGGKASSGDKKANADLGTTRENPAPLGSAITGDDWTVKINSVKTVSEDSISQKPAAGSTLLLINMSATYNGDDSQGETPWASVKFVGTDGATIDSTSGSTMFIADNEFDSMKTLYNGASVKGDQILEVPADSWKDGVLAVSPAMMSDDTFVSLK
jgi:hypothetical protein